MNHDKLNYFVVLDKTYMRTQESQDRLKKLILKEKTELMKPDVDLWLYKNDLPKDLKAVTRNKKDMKTVIMENIHKLEDKNDIDLDVQNMLSVLPIKDKQSITWVLFKSSLKEVNTSSSSLLNQSVSAGRKRYIYISN